MCGGKYSDEPPPPPARPIELPDRTTYPSTSQRPQSSNGRRPCSVSKHRPGSSSARATSASKHRRRSSATRPLETPDGSQREPPHRDYRTRGRIHPEVEEYTEDRRIITRLDDLSVFIKQHTENFFPHHGPGNQGIPELDNPYTRHAAIRRYLAHTIISSTVPRDINSSLDKSAIVREISNYLAPYFNVDEQRENHLVELCQQSSLLHLAIDNNPSHWEFDFSSVEGYIVMIPALKRDGEEVVPSRGSGSTRAFN
ncbi:hypothetical protein BDZ45DRAFT_734192 [Acephala macrosclerotiorum]|nr:hypothetical protein BDZ45DRAFT_734192 [Acephala macrosclerotiorum]